MSIADAVERASAYLTEHPDEARYRDSFARATLVRGLAVSVIGPTGETLTTDMPKGIGGGRRLALARVVPPSGRGLVRYLPGRDPRGLDRRGARVRERDG